MSQGRTLHGGAIVFLAKRAKISRNCASTKLDTKTLVELGDTDTGTFPSWAANGLRDTKTHPTQRCKTRMQDTKTLLAEAPFTDW